MKEKPKIDIAHMTGLVIEVMLKNTEIELNEEEKKKFAIIILDNVMAFNKIVKSNQLGAIIRLLNSRLIGAFTKLL